MATSPCDADTGAEITVNHDSGTESYLSHSGGEQLQFTTINDSTFVCNRNQVTAMTSATTDARPHTLCICRTQGLRMVDSMG